MQLRTVCSSNHFTFWMICHMPVYLLCFWKLLNNVSLIYDVYFLCKLFLHHVYIITLFVYCFILEWGSHVKLAFWFLNCKTCVFMYEAPSEMIETYLEYRLRDDDSHTVAQSTDSTLRPVHHCQCFRMVGWYVLTCRQHCKLFVKWWLCSRSFVLSNGW